MQRALTLPLVAFSLPDEVTPRCGLGHRLPTLTLHRPVQSSGSFQSRDVIAPEVGA